MVSFNTFFTSVLLAIAYASLVAAAPWPIHARHSTHRVRTVGRRGLKVEAFHPTTTYKTYGAGKDQPPVALVGRATPTIKELALSFMQSEIGINPSTVSYKSGFAEGTGKFAYLAQAYNGVPFANAVANVAWNNGKVVSFGSSFVEPKQIAPSKPSIPVESIIASTEGALDGTFNGQEPGLEYLARPDGSIALAHVIQIQNEEAGTWVEAYVDAHSGDILSVSDFVSHASYTVLPIEKQAFRDGVETLEDPQDLDSSPLGWHDNGTINSTTTSGNNVVAFKTSLRATSVQSSRGLNFDFAYDDTLDPTMARNLNAARVNAFYIINTVHDFSYKYGFTENAFNFQSNNFGKGGRGNDPVIMSVQDESGVNNANFATPPDGQAGICRMFIWSLTNPKRDGALENDIIVHEMTHGITNRMTGGGSGRCLQTTEAGGMGEGWSDAMAEWTEQRSAAVQDYVLGAYVTDSDAGIRSFPYSTSAVVNPLRYSSIQTLNEVHNIGEVWANILHNVYAALVGEHGFSATALTDPTGTEGNVVYMHLFMDALARQPCNPTFVSARDAWIQADEDRFNGANVCLLWKAFASRGLGLNARNFVDSEAVPSECD